MDNLAVECQGLSRNFGGRKAVSDLDFTVPKGTVFGFLGSNGAGKTTTVRMMVGMLRPSSGTVRVLGMDPIAEGDVLRSRCGVMLDNVGLYDRLTAYQNLVFAAKVARLENREAKRRIEEVLHRVSLWDRRNDRVSGFSKGMRQKLGLARALISQPEILILDEPTAGLDPGNIVMVRELLVSLAQESGRTIFLCTHLLAEAQRICDQVAILQGGHLLAIGDPNGLGGQSSPAFRIRVSDATSDAMTRLALPMQVHWNQVGPGEWRVTVPSDADIEVVVAALVGAGMGVRAVVPENVSLEEEYLRLVGGNAQ